MKTFKLFLHESERDFFASMSKQLKALHQIKGVYDVYSVDDCEQEYFTRLICLQTTSETTYKRLMAQWNTYVPHYDRIALKAIA